MADELFNLNRTYRKAYKYGHNGNYNMIPSDPNGSLDESFFNFNLSIHILAIGGLYHG